MRAKFLVLIGLVVLATSRPVHAELLLALTGSNQLVSFDSSTPGTTSTLAITGLTGGDVLNSIDSRPFNGDLYGFAVTGSVGRLYTINRNTGAAMLASTLDTAINGNFFGVDFNPTVDRLRIVSDTAQNYRVNVGTGAVTTDGALQYAAGDVNAGTPPQVVASAYTNSVAGALTTTLYGLDLATQSLVSQAPPNNGTLNTIGTLSSILFPEAAFDISGLTGVAYAIMNSFELATVNLATGETTTIGAINAPGNLIGLSAPVGITAVPEPSSVLLVAIGAIAYGVRRRQLSIRTKAS